MDEAARITDQARVLSRLADLGLDEQDLRAAVQFGVSESSRCTANEPKNSRGFTQWAKTVGMLRERLIPKKWDRRDDDNFPTAVNRDGSLAIGVLAGNLNTGSKTQDPQSRWPKGRAAKKLINRNQMQLADLDPSLPRAPQGEPDQTWLLLYFTDEETGETRWELSLPIRMEIDGSIAGWHQRLVLAPITNHPTPTKTADDEQEIKIDIERRAS